MSISNPYTHTHTCINANRYQLNSDQIGLLSIRILIGNIAM